MLSPVPMMMMQARDNGQAQFLAERGCVPSPDAPMQPGDTLTEHFARSCPGTPDGRALSSAALGAVARQRQAVSEAEQQARGQHDDPFVRQPPQASEAGGGAPGDEISLSPEATDEPDDPAADDPASGDDAAAMEFGRRWQEQEEDIRSGAWLGERQI